MNREWSLSPAGWAVVAKSANKWKRLSFFYYFATRTGWNFSIELKGMGFDFSSEFLFSITAEIEKYWMCKHIKYIASPGVRPRMTKLSMPATITISSSSDMGTFFLLGGSDLRLGGGGVYTPQTPKKFARGEQKKKRSPVSLKIGFYYVEKIAIPPTSFGRRYEGPWGGYIPPIPPPHAHVWSSSILAFVSSITE